MELKIDLKKLKESGLFFEEFVILALINDGINPEDFNWCKLPEETRSPHMRELENNMWIKPTEDGYLLREKGRQLFEEKSSDINFDEFWDNFPTVTSDGRVLRASNKLWAGALTRDYIVCKKKYLSKVKNKATHDKIVSVIKARVATGDTKYMQGIEVYINQESWQKDVKYLTMKPKQIDNGNIFTFAGENR